MFKFALVALLCAQAYARPSYVDPLIVGGKPVNIDDYPYMVSLRLRHTSAFFCGGGLVSVRHVLTAAHCVHDSPDFDIAAGSVKLASQSFYEVDYVKIHPEYEPRKILNDIALIRIKKAILTIKPVNFPINEDLTGKAVTALGWGRTSEKGPISEHLLYLVRHIIDKTECREKLGREILDSQICLEGEKNFGMCFGDSGSPLIYKTAENKEYVAGVVSCGVPCARGFPDVFTNVSSFHAWIKKNMM